ncbi:MAG: prepilin-type N-terminal cleavage/methylation domain-containing protein [Elusimicrobiaceae bacterium]|nr:prepilin-type N-terminal cleavage/methylation domain-containing protein [Elusimicrobiaceae bacterium]
MKGKIKQSSKTGNKGFTLIELLVVVLIIGILAAIALPQYQKTIEKSKAAEGISMLKAVAQSAQFYYMVNGIYPTQFDQLDIDVPWTGNTAFISIPSKSNKDWSIEMQHFSNDKFVIHNARISGKYKGAGFMLIFRTYNIYSYLNDENNIKCFERKTNANFLFDSNLPEGAYCEKVINANYFNEDQFVRVYNLNY